MKTIDPMVMKENNNGGFVCWVKVLMVFLLLMVGRESSMAQNSAGSVYSIFGIGELTPSTSVQAKGMGYTSIGLSNPYSVNIVNPAANDQTGAYFNHMVDIGFYYANMKYQSQGVTENATSGGLSNFSFWFRFNNRWSGLVGMSQYSNVGYNISRQAINSFQNGEYDVQYTGSGGLSEMYFSNGFSLMKNLSLGLKLSFIFGNIEHSEDVTSSQNLRQFSIDNSIHIANVDAEYSLNYRFSRPKYNVNVGLIYKNPTHFGGTAVSTISELDYSSDESAVLYEEKESVEDYILPRRIGFGLSVNTDKVTIAGDIEFNQWSHGSIENYDDDLVDTWRYSMGMEWTPNREGDSFTSRISYRMGAYLENSYLKVNETNFNKYGITGGLSVPLPRGNAVNIAYHWKINGTVDNSLIYETTNEISINFTIRQRWFQRAKYN